MCRRVGKYKHLHNKENSLTVTCSSIDSYRIVNTQISWLCLAIILFFTPRRHYPPRTETTGLSKAYSSSHKVVSTPFHADSAPKDRGSLPSVVQLKAGS